MKCIKCNFENDDNSKYCIKCGFDLHSPRVNVGNTNTNLRKSFGNKIVFGMFTITLILLFIYLVLELFIPVFNCGAGACSGFFLLVVPMVMGMFFICLIIGWIVSIFNMKFNKKILTFVEFISSLLSIFILLSELLENCAHHILHMTIIVSLILLMIACLVELVIQFSSKN